MIVKQNQSTMKTLRSYLYLTMYLAVAVSLAACVAAVPAVIYYQSTKNYVATVELDAAADTVYQTAIREVEARGDRLKIVEREDAKRLLEVTDGTQTAELKMVSIDPGKTKLIVTANLPGREQEKEKELALKVVDVVCKSLGVEYTLLEE